MRPSRRFAPRPDRRCWPALALLLAVASTELQAAGSWIAEAPALRVSVIGRDTVSAALRPGGMTAEGEAITSITWRYRLPPGRALNARLCHPAGCVALPAMRGTTRALAGLPADAPLAFHFSLPRGEDPIRVGGLQVIVNHR
ncbi:flagellar protein FlhE [Halomonas saccharevitans]|uniref:Flagellar protein FlhE n=1 Tax=Halomonas saccharevitans TaxID=416872 RepID=A0A1I6Z1I5_9GAMM|nr:flagellar protein FlhE [Halomonas saccharevitans]SFT56600.1 flagellar protein FlhE [Halomonas saccharevitans]